MTVIMLLSVTDIAKAQQHAFSSISPSMHTLYYEIVDNGAMVVRPIDIYEGEWYYTDYVLDGNLIFPDTVEYEGVKYPVISVRNSTFVNCDRIKSVIFSNTMKSIGNTAFSFCDSLESITIGKMMDTIYDGAFRDCPRLTSIYFNADSCKTVSTDGGDNNLVFRGSPIQSIVFGDNVIKIPNYCCKECTGLTSVVIPNSVQSMGRSVFEGCTGLTSITLSNTLNVIPQGTFFRCTSLSTFSIPNSVTEIGSSAFGFCSGLTSIELTNSIVKVGRNAFMGCNSLNSPVYNNTLFVYLPGNYTGCYSIPEGPKVICSSAFCDAESVDSVILGPSVLRIDPYAFVESGIEYISIGENVDSILRYAFSGCSDLMTVRSLAQQPPLCVDEPFSGLPYAATLYVPCGTKSMYETSYGWRNFNTIVEECSNGISCPETDENIIWQENGKIIVKSNQIEEVLVYNIEGKQVSRIQTPEGRTQPLQPGAYFVSIGNKLTRKIVIVK